MKIIPETSHLN